MAKNRILQSLVALFIILVGNPFLMSCQSCTLVWMHYLKFKSSTDFSVQDISWQGCSLFWFSHLSGKVIDLWLSDRRIKWAAATNKQRVLFMSVSNFYCYSYKSELTMHRTHIEQIRWSSPKHRQGRWKLQEFGWGNPKPSLKIRTASSICWNYLGLFRDYGLDHFSFRNKTFFHFSR